MLKKLELVMLKIYRRIRKKFLDERNAKRYLIYAIGEISLVMIGILLALQVNNWNGNREDRKLEKKYLNSIILDLTSDSINYNNRSQYMDEVIKDINASLKLPIIGS